MPINKTNIDSDQFDALTSCSRSSQPVRSGRKRKLMLSHHDSHCKSQLLPWVMMGVDSTNIWNGCFFLLSPTVASLASHAFPLRGFPDHSKFELVVLMGKSHSFPHHRSEYLQSVDSDCDLRGDSSDLIGGPMFHLIMALYILSSSLVVISWHPHLGHRGSWEKSPEAYRGR